MEAARRKLNSSKTDTRHKPVTSDTRSSGTGKISMTLKLPEKLLRNSFIQKCKDCSIAWLNFLHLKGFSLAVAKK